MKVLFRVDASYRIGSGHFARCRVLAEALAQEGADIVFACRELPGFDPTWILQNGMRFFSLPAYYADEDHSGEVEASADWQQQDFVAVSACLGSEYFDWLIVDHYQLDRAWQYQMRRFTARIAVIDDLDDRHHDCELLLDQNLGESSTDSSHVACRVFKGPRHALLRSCFREASSAIREQVTRILVNFGSNDLSGSTLRAARALTHFPEIQIDIIAGKNNPDSPAILALVRDRPFMRVHAYVERIDELMQCADLAIGGGGVSLWERAALSVPSICVAVASNQRRSAAALGYAGGHLFLGNSDEIDESDLIDAVRVMTRHHGLRSALAEKARELVDGWGGERIAAALWSEHLHVRQACLDDAEKLFEWRNADPVRKSARNSEPISWQQHLTWFEKKRATPESVLLVVETDRAPVGVLRYDRKDQPEVAEVSIYLVPSRIGKNWGGEMLAAGDKWIAGFWPELRRIEACVLPRNSGSQRMFRDRGYSQQDCVFVRAIRDE